MIIVLFSWDCAALRFYLEDKPKQVDSYPLRRGRQMKNAEIHNVIRARLRGRDGVVPQYRFHYLGQGKGYELPRKEET